MVNYMRSFLPDPQHFSIFSSISEAKASEILENNERCNILYKHRTCQYYSMMIGTIFYHLYAPCAPFCMNIAFVSGIINGLLNRM